MNSSVGLEVMNTANTDLSWKTVTKGRRSRKSVARTLNGVTKVGNSTSPKRVGDFSGSDSDKLADAVAGQSTLGKSENVPIKKRRHLLQSPSHDTRTPASLCGQGSGSPGTLSCSPSSGDREPPHPPCSSGQRSFSAELRGADGGAKVRVGCGFDNDFLNSWTKHECMDTDDFSGIKLLAAAASMNDVLENASEDLIANDTLIPKTSDESSFAAQSKLCFKSNESENSSSSMTHASITDSIDVQNNSATALQSLSESLEDGTMTKVDRKHWDLNTPMDAWDEPYGYSIARLTTKNDNDDMLMQQRPVGSREHINSYTGGMKDELSYPRIEENKSIAVSPDRICSELPSFKECLPGPAKSSHSNAESSDGVTGKEDAKNSNHVSGYVAHVETSNMNTNAILDSSPLTEDEDCSSNMSECERTAPSDIQTRTDDVIAHHMPASEMSGSVIDVLQRHTEESQKTSELHGTFIQDVQPVLSSDLNIQNDGTLASISKIADCKAHSQSAELLSKHEDNNYFNVRSKRIMMEDPYKSCSAGTQCDDPTTYVGKVASTIDSRHASDISQSNHAPMGDGNNLIGFQEGYDSPYEDGELRGSFLYSWEDELETECVDYESDGRNGDGSDNADYPGSDVVDGGSEGSHCTGRKSLLVKKFPEGSGSGAVKHSLGKHSLKDIPDSNEVAGKGSNAGSGITVEQSSDMVTEENDKDIKRRQLIEHGEMDVVKMTQVNEYLSKMARAKLQSRIEGRSDMDPTDGKEEFFMQQCRSHRLSGTYSRDISADKYMGKSRPPNHGERGVHQWTSWGSRRRYNSNCQVTENRSQTRPRNTFGDSADKIGGFDYHDPRQTNNYLSKGVHRPFMRRSPVERDDYFNMRRRMPLTRGVNNYRSRGHYSQRGSRDFGEQFEPVPDDAVAVRMPRYIPSREQSFSPSSTRGGHMPLPRRRSRSRSRTRSPKPWHSHRERQFSNRRQSRSPDFRPEARMDRMRAPFPKPTFGSEYEEDYISPSRGRFSPQRNFRWVDDHNFTDNHMRRRRSPVRQFKHTQRFDGVGSSGRLKTDEYFKPMIRRRRYSFMENGDRRREGNAEMMMHRGMQSDDGVNPRRFRHNVTNGYGTSNINNEDGVTDPRDMPQIKGDRDEKRAFKI